MYTATENATNKTIAAVFIASRVVTNVAYIEELNIFNVVSSNAI